MKIDEVPIASIIEKPSSEVKIAIRNIPPPTPNNPEEKPTNNPMIPEFIKLNEILAFSLSLLMLMILFTATNSNKHPKIISRILNGSDDATNPPINPPIIPNIPNCTPGLIIPSIERECLYAPLIEVGIIIAKLVPNEIRIAKSEFTPMYCKRKYCRGTIRNPPPIPRSPDAKPANMPIIIKPMKYSIGNINIIYLNH